MSFRFRVCFALETTELLSQGDTLIQLKPEQRTALRAHFYFDVKTLNKIKILGHAQNIVFIALWFGVWFVGKVGIIVSTNVVLFVFQNPARIFKNSRKFVLAVGGLKDRKAESKIG